MVGRGGGIEKPTTRELLLRGADDCPQLRTEMRILPSSPLQFVRSDYEDCVPRRHSMRHA